MSDSSEQPRGRAAAGRAKPVEVRVRRNLAAKLRDAATYTKAIVALVVIAGLGVGGYYAYGWANDAIQGVKELTTVSTKSLECPASMRQGGALCYEKCPEGWQSDGTNGCYQPCPAGWKGTETLTHCQHRGDS